MKAIIAALLLCFLTLPAQAALKKGDAFPFLTLPSLDGKSSIDLAKYKGRILIVDLWASWCGPCKVEIPFLNDLAKRNSSLVVVAVNLDDHPADASAFLKDHPVQITLAYDGEKKALVSKVDVDVLPTSFVVDASGTVVARHEAFRPIDAKIIEGEVMGLLSRKK